jgi:hypothetical protein
MGRWADAIADYDAALHVDPNIASSRYKRGLAKLRMGHATQGNADVAAAKAIDAHIADLYAPMGVHP